MRKIILLNLCVTLPVVLAACDNTAPVGKADREVQLRPGDDLRTIVADAPEGTRFVLTKGVYRQQRFAPKDRQEFVGMPGAVLNGAMVLVGWQQKGGHWVKEGLPAPLQRTGMCGKEDDPVDTDICTYREDLFLDGRVYQRVGELKDLGPGKWFYRDGTAFVSDDPSGRVAELSVTPNAITSTANNVVLRNLNIEKYATAAQAGAIDARDTEGWQIIDVTAKWNHGLGVYIGRKMLVRGGSYSHNGQMGMGGAGNQSVVEGVEMAYNNYAGFMPTWEAGGAKFVFSNDLVIRNNCVHHNYGNGIWTDIDNINITIEGNKVFDNEGSGIMHEISYKATIRNNTVVRNGRNKYDWLWGSQIVVQNSQDVDVHGNVVEVAPDFGNGISLIYQNRGAGKYGAYLTANNNVSDNQVILTGAKGKSGMVADFEGDRFWNQMGNKFHKNAYIAPANNGANWSFKGDKTWSELQAMGFEESSTLKLAVRRPMAVSCAKAS